MWWRLVLSGPLPSQPLDDSASVDQRPLYLFLSLSLFTALSLLPFITSARSCSWDWGLKMNFGDSDSFNFGGSSFGFDTFLLKNLFLAHYKICSIRQN